QQLDGGPLAGAAAAAVAPFASSMSTIAEQARWVLRLLSGAAGAVLLLRRALAKQQREEEDRRALLAIQRQLEQLAAQQRVIMQHVIGKVPATQLVGGCGGGATGGQGTSRYNADTVAVLALPTLNAGAVNSGQALRIPAPLSLLGNTHRSDCSGLVHGGEDQGPTTIHQDLVVQSIQQAFGGVHEPIAVPPCPEPIMASPGAPRGQESLEVPVPGASALTCKPAGGPHPLMDDALDAACCALLQRGMQGGHPRDGAPAPAAAGSSAAVAGLVAQQGAGLLAVGTSQEQRASSTKRKREEEEVTEAPQEGEDSQSHQVRSKCRRDE
ncbi:hypothetical protein Agub_g4413, partial [Astrephomene gubernaculifera]